MWEPGTEATAYPDLQVFSQPAAAILPDEPMVFHLKLTNKGVAGWRFWLFASLEQNVGGLTLAVNGGSLDKPQIYESIEAGQTVFSAFSIRRGPELYTYPSIDIGLGIQCDDAPWNSVTSVATLWNKKDMKTNETSIEFAQPCPKVYWANLDDGYTISINKAKALEIKDKLELTVFNPAYMLSSFGNAINTSRLERVALRYRRVGDFDWDYALRFDQSNTLLTDSDGIPFNSDFSLNEDKFYGYAKSTWEYSNLQQTVRLVVCLVD